MSEEFEGQEEEQLTLGGVGQTLREAREEKGLDLKQVAAETRIPERHLLAIENGDFAALPARTYAVGFSRSYARMLGLDEKLIAADVRAELSIGAEQAGGHVAQFEPGDPARIPSRRLAWLSGLAALLLIVGGFSFYRSHIAPGSGPAPLVEDAVEQQLAQTEATPSAGIDPDGEVVFTALEDGVWARFYDANGSRLFEKQMTQGERFVVPSDASSPQIWTGRPDALAITIGGRDVPKLADDDTVMRDVAIDATSLLARREEPAPVDTETVTRRMPAVERSVPTQTVNSTPATQATRQPVAPAEQATPASVSATNPETTSVSADEEEAVPAPPEPVETPDPAEIVDNSAT